MAQKIEMDKKLGGSDIDSDFSLHRDFALICNLIGQKILSLHENIVGTGFLTVYLLILESFIIF